MKRFLLILLSLTVIAAAALVLFFGGCSQSSRPQWIFLVTLDTTRADHIDYSPGNAATPNLAALAAEGQYFENAYALIPITLPSHANIFYSLPPHQLRIYNNGQVRQAPHPSLAQLVKGKGFTTAAAVSLGVLKSDFGLDKGFDSYIEKFPKHLWSKTAEEVNRDAFGYIQKNLSHPGPFFFWLHYSDPHEPYFPAHGKDTGQFLISLDGREIFVSKCTEQPVVNTTFKIKPGLNRLVLESKIPPSFFNRPDCPTTLEYIKYRDFILEPADAKDFPGKQKAKITLPENWNTKTTRGGINYYADTTRSELLAENPYAVPVSMNLRFIYSLHVDDTTRKVFYNEEVKYLDRELGKLIRFLKEKNIYENSVFVIVGDHGESLGDYRNHFGHIHFLDRSSVSVPLIMAGKGIEARGKRGEPVTTLNIAPTILDIAGVEKPSFMLGQSLLKPLARTRMLLETYSPEAYFDAFSIIDYPYQISFYPGRRKEKIEFVNLKTGAAGGDAQTDSQSKKKRTELINAVLKISRIITATKRKTGKTSKRHQEILKSLGYL
jgi:hypothetical protein